MNNYGGYFSVRNVSSVTIRCINKSQCEYNTQIPITDVEKKIQIVCQL